MSTNYAGIDYGLGKSNVATNGLRYGIISQHSVDMDRADCIWSNGRDLGYEAFTDQVKGSIRQALSDYFSDHKWDNKTSKLDQAVENAYEAISDSLGDSYQGESGPMLYEDCGYKLQTTETDIWVLESPYYTFAQFCSPCAPGAGNLDSPLDTEGTLALSSETKEKYSSNKTLCLGHDWFDGDKAPYPVFDIATGEQVNP